MSKVKLITGAALLTCTGVLGAYGVATAAGSATRTTTGPSEKSASVTTTSTTEGTALPAKKAAPEPAKKAAEEIAKKAAAKAAKKAAPEPAKKAASKRPAVLSGKREVTIVRVQAFESAVTLDNGELTEADDDSGRQLFVPTPIRGNTYLIKAFDRPNGHPANDEPACWQVYNPNSTESLTIEGAVCDAKNPAQQFTITAQGKKTYAISNSSAFLQYFPDSGLILEELGDAPLVSTFRFVPAGPARTPAGG
jgi:hypothetical protein